MKEGRLNIDLLQKSQAETELKSAEDVLPRAVRECYKWLLCPTLDAPTEPKPGVEVFALNTTGGSAGGEIERVCTDNWINAVLRSMPLPEHVFAARASA